jgi:hypothetical protein
MMRFSLPILDAVKQVYETDLKLRGKFNFGMAVRKIKM